MNSIKRIRTQILRVTQEAFAEATGTRQPVVSAWESGARDPKKSSLDRILAAYPTLDPAEFFRPSGQPGEVIDLDQSSAGAESVPGDVVT